MTKIDQMIAFTRAHETATYCTDPDRRFGPTCYDCSGWCWACFHQVGLEIPKDSADVARWGRDRGYLASLGALIPGDLLIHDRYGDPYNSYGARGHIGWVTGAGPGWVTTSESASSGGGVGFYTRKPSFWCLAVRVPGLYDEPIHTTQEVPDMTAEEHQLLKDVHAMLSGVKAGYGGGCDPTDPMVALGRALGLMANGNTNLHLDGVVVAANKAAQK